MAKDWEFIKPTNRRIDFDLNDFALLNYINFNEPSFKACISCGTCTATCSAGSFMQSFNIRKIFTLIKRGETHTIKEQIENCMFCGKCQLVCPRGVNTRNVIHYIKKGVQEL